MNRFQLPLALKPPRRPSFDNFIAGPNRAVVGTLRDGLESAGWYFLRGPAGSGRSHLVASAFAERCRRGESARFIALSQPDQVELLAHTCGDWIMIDDVDAVAGVGEAEHNLFSALNRWRDERCGLIMSGRGRDRFELPDLRSRLDQAVRLALTPLDEAGLAQLIRQLAEEHEVPLGRGVINYLLSRAPRNAARLSELIERCSRRALAQRRAVSVPLVRELIADC